MKRSFNVVFTVFLLLSGCNETVLKGKSSFAAFNPLSCGTKGISYASIHSQILIRNCTVNGCHSGSSINLTTYEEVKANLAQVKEAVLADRMPPRGPLAAIDKELLVTWINQGAPFNEEDANLECSGDPGDVDPPPPVLQATYESLKANVFMQNCLGCHKAGARIGDFSTYEAITSEGISELFDIEHPDRSEFVARLVTDNERAVMPPQRTGLPKLSLDVVEVIETWIANGMPKE
ncbi:MAG: hypothetical protein R3A80_04185 [Bdellovibrionota bacterium]